MTHYRCACGYLGRAKEPLTVHSFRCATCGKNDLAKELGAQARRLPRPLLDPLLWCRGMIRFRRLAQFTLALLALAAVAAIIHASVASGSQFPAIAMGWAFG